MTCDHHAAHVAHAAQAALERLAAALERDAFATALVTGIDGIPRLSVICRQTKLTEQVHAMQGWYFWQWAEAIGPNEDPHAAAATITATMHAFAGLEPAS